MTKLSSRDLLALGFMTLALFLGAGNIIYPPFSGMQQGNHIWLFAGGFLVTAVGLPVLTIVALARINGAVDALCTPIGRICSTLFAVVCYLTVGPLFATPRTATVSYEIAISPFLGGNQGHIPLALYSIAYFLVTLIVSFYPGQLLDTVGKVLAPIKIIAVLLLGISAFVVADSMLGHHPLMTPESTPFQTISSGISNGYLTMDTIGALVFGIVIVRAIQSRGVSDKRLVARYAIIAGLMAGFGLTVIYIAFFRLGLDSQLVAKGADTGAKVLSSYVHYVFGRTGDYILGFLIIIACLVTSVGLTCACSEYFSSLLGWSERYITVLLVVFSAVVSNLGLNHLIAFSMPLLFGLGPICVVLVLLSLGNHLWHSCRLVIVPPMLVALLFGVVQFIRAAGFSFLSLDDSLLSRLPLYPNNLEWVLPVAVAAALSIALDRARHILSKTPQN